MATSYYQGLQVWNISMDLVQDVYTICKNFPKEETYWIVDQMKRASVSIPSNIAEWSGRKNKTEFIQFLYIARASLMELETQMILSQRLWFISKIQVSSILEKITSTWKMLSALISSMK